MANALSMVTLEHAHPPNVEPPVRNVERDEAHNKGASKSHKDVLVRNIGGNGDLTRMFIKPLREVFRDRQNRGTIRGSCLPNCECFAGSNHVLAR